jgi:hypothetical protein
MAEEARLRDAGRLALTSAIAYTPAPQPSKRGRLLSQALWPMFLVLMVFAVFWQRTLTNESRTASVTITRRPLPASRWLTFVLLICLAFAASVGATNRPNIGFWGISALNALLAVILLSAVTALCCHVAGSSKKNKAHTATRGAKDGSWDPVVSRTHGKRCPEGRTKVTASGFASREMFAGLRLLGELKQAHLGQPLCVRMKARTKYLEEHYGRVWGAQVIKGAQSDLLFVHMP